MEEIGSLERRHKELVKILSRIDPQIYVSKLQHELAKLQEQNQILRSSLPAPSASLPQQEVEDQVTFIFPSLTLDE
jgi:hypothetical protein